MPRAADRPAKYRHEYKYEISLFDFFSLTRTLRTIMQPDPHADQDGQYLITSLYFDNCFDKALREKRDGLNQREKFRLRYYGSAPEKVFLEKTRGSLSQKRGTAHARRVQAASCRTAGLDARAK